MMVIYLPVKFEFDWTEHFISYSPETEMLTDRQTDKRKVKFEFDWTEHFQVRVRKQKC